MRITPSRGTLWRASFTIAVSASIVAGSVVLASGATAAPAGSASRSAASSASLVRGLGTGSRLYVPAPSSGAPQQMLQLLKGHDLKDAALIAAMEAIPRAVWFTGGTPAQVKQQVAQTMAAAAIQRAVPVLVAYDIPGRDCAQYSAGGALDLPSYEAWIDGFARGIGSHRAAVILEPDGLGLLPSDCGSAAFTNADRFAELQYAVSALEARPGVSVYLDGTHSAWQAVGGMTQRLLQAGVRNAQGFFLDVSNYQPTANLVNYGTWISDCIAIVTDPSNGSYNNPSACASQFASDPSAWYAQNMGGAVATTHFVIDTSRNGTGPNNMQSYANPPYNQQSSVISTLSSGSWCNPPGAGLGLRPTTATEVPLLDAYLWVKTPGQSDGQCDAAGGVRAWDYSAYSLPGWPATSAGQALFDPLWGIEDPAAGAWFAQQALQLAQLANPALPAFPR